MRWPTLIISIFVLLFFSAIVLAQDSDEIVKIQVDGNLNIEKQEIISALDDYLGKEISRKKLRAGISTVYELGFFEDVKMKAIDTKEGIVLITTVKEKPRLKYFRVIGNKFIKPRHIQQALELRADESRFVDKEMLDRCTEKIVKLYRDSGYYFAVVYPRTELDELTNEMTVTYVVDEGMRVKVKDVSIAGSSLFGQDELLSGMKTKKTGFLTPGIFSYGELEEDIEKITSKYHNKGFINTEVFHRLYFDDKEKLVSVLLTIEEGNQYKVRSIAIDGNNALSNNEFRKSFPLAGGDVFSRELFKKGINNIRSFYSRNGFLLLELKQSIRVNDIERSVDIRLGIDEGPGTYYINKIAISGNQKTDENLIRRFLLVKENDVFDGYKIFLSQRKLQELGYFTNVEILTQPTDTPNKRNLVVQLEEGGTSMFEAGFKYSTTFDGSIYAKYDEKNLFGKGQRLSLNTDLGGKKEDSRISFTNPYLFDKELMLKTNLYLNETKIPRRYFKEKRAGGDIGLGRQLFTYTYWNTVYKYEEVKTYDVGPEVAGYITPDKSTVAGTTTSLTRDTRDSSFYALRGSLNRISVENSASYLGSDYNFVKLIVDSNTFFSPLGETVLSIRLRGGLSSGYDGKKIPLFEKFYLGGVSTIRGYEEGEVAPPQGGKAMGIFNLEYRIPLTKKKTVVNSYFYDAGNAWEATGDFDLSDLKQGVGTSLTYYSKLGMVGLTYGYGIDKHKDEIYVNIGNNF